MSLKLFSQIVFVGLVLSFALARECTENDYTGEYTECKGNKRNVIYYWKPDVTCEGGVQLPPNKFNLRCDIACGVGRYLPLGETECEDCGKGTFSFGGGTRVSSFGPDWKTASDLNFETYCTARNGERLPSSACAGWGPSSDEITLKSGNLSHDQNSILEMSALLITEGHIHFVFQVDAEPFYDGLSFYVNNRLVMERVSNTIDFEEFRYELESGFYTLSWVYSKDYSVSRGKDAALLKMIEIGGTEYAETECDLCEPGTFNNRTGQEDCQACPIDTFAADAGSETCEPCPPSQHSYTGATSCIDRPLCTSADYEHRYTTCRGPSPGYRSKEYFYKEPIICNYHNYTLPATETDLDCGLCNSGMVRSSVTFQCEPCPSGFANKQEATCHPCAAGTAAIKGFYFTRWDYLPSQMATGCAGQCGTRGWRLLGDSIDSGAGHGAFTQSWVGITLQLETNGWVEFQFTMECSQGCTLEFSDGGLQLDFFYSGFNRTVRYPLSSGSHSLRWNFQKQDPHQSARNDKVVLYRVEAVGDPSGGASECVSCDDGFIAEAQSSLCTACPPGKSSNSGNTECVDCPANTFSSKNGSACVPCGRGTWSAPGSTECITDCSFNVTIEDNTIVYDLSPLQREGGDMYGPIYDKNNQAYYINVCSKHHSNQSCIDRSGRPIEAFSCQVTTHGYGEDLGQVIAFNTLTDDSRGGVVVSYTDGSEGCGTKRATNLEIICDPEAGRGFPVGANPLEDPQCFYSFEWRSIYGCPVCSADDYTFYFTQCLGGRQTKIYTWKENPRHCHAGVSLPADEEFDCSQPTFSCPAGYAALSGTTNCTVCPGGSYSIGGGFHFSEWEKLPFGWRTSCSGDNCQPWRPFGTTIAASSPGTARLDYEGEWVTAGSVAFSYRLTPGVFSRLFFYVDDSLVHIFDHLELDVVTFSTNISSGSHLLRWEFQNALEYPGTRASLYDIKILGAALAATACSICPPGTFSEKSEGSSSCRPCPVNTFSDGGDAECTPCEKHQYAPPGSAGCKARPACTENDFQQLFTPCRDGFRTQYFAAIEPQVCEGSHLNETQQVICADCPAGSRREQDECVGCPNDNEHWDGAVCQPSGVGYRVGRTLNIFSDNSLNNWPAGWTTGCGGPCGSGWRFRGTFIDSGDHSFFDSSAPLDSFVDFSVELIGDGKVEFEYQRDSNALFEFFIDGVPQKISESNNGLVDFPLAKGSRVLRWNYHIPAGVSHSVAPGRLMNVVVVGSNVGSSRQYPCPSGSSSHAQSIECSLCQPGYHSSTPMESSCDICPRGTYSNKLGAVECYPCGNGATSNEGATSCETDCKLSLQQGDIEYDILPLSNKTFQVETLEGKYSLRLCGMLDSCVNHLNESMETSVCFTNAYGFGGDRGSSVNFQPLSGDSVKKGFRLKIQNGGGDKACLRAETDILFKCNVSAGEGTPEYISTSSPCSPQFVWESGLGCPVCTQADYDVTRGTCEDSQQEVVLIRSVDCNGPYTLRSVSPCSMRLEFPVAVVVVGVLLFVTAVVIGIILYIRQRRMYSDYVRLKTEVEGRVELDAIE